jgi:hypothetical protein
MRAEVMMRRSIRALALSLLVQGCAHEPPAAPPSDDPYAALSALADQIQEGVRLAREAGPSRVPGGEADGAIHVVRQLLRAIDEELAWADTEHPYFVHQDTRFAKLALGNPDNLYTVVRVDDDASYRIHGVLGTTSDFAIQIYQGYPGVGRPFAALGSLDLGNLETGEDGSFDVIVSPEPPHEGNWIQMLPGTRRILVRYTYGDWNSEAAGELRIERIGSQTTRSKTPDATTVANRLEATSFYFMDALRGYLATTEAIHARMEANTLPPLRRSGDGGLTGQYTVNGHYAVDDDHALIVTTRPSDARYQGFQIGNWWFDALDYANRITSLNTEQAQLGSDGLYRFVISTRDPGVPNWLDAAGNPEGLLLLRWQGVGELGPEHQPTIELVPIGDVRARFPGDAPRIGAATRAEQITRRKAAIDRRFGLTGR